MTENAKRETVILPTKKIVVIGVYGGLLWSFVFLALYFLNLSEFGTNIVVKLFFSFDWVLTIWGQLFGIVIITFASVIISCLYYFFFKHLEGMLPGIVLGAVCFLISVYATRPFLTTKGSYAKDFGEYTVVAMACVFLLWGITITYSISFEANNETLPGSIYSKRN